MQLATTEARAETKPSSHADLAGCGGEAEWDIPKVGGGSLISKESEGVSTNCQLEPVEEVSPQLLLPQREPPTEDVNPSHGCVRSRNKVGSEILIDASRKSASESCPRGLGHLAHVTVRSLWEKMGVVGSSTWVANIDFFAHLHKPAVQIIPSRSLDALEDGLTNSMPVLIHER